MECIVGKLSKGESTEYRVARDGGIVVASRFSIPKTELAPIPKDAKIRNCALIISSLIIVKNPENRALAAGVWSTERFFLDACPAKKKIAVCCSLWMIVVLLVRSAKKSAALSRQAMQLEPVLYLAGEFSSYRGLAALSA